MPNQSQKFEVANFFTKKPWVVAEVSCDNHKNFTVTKRYGYLEADGDIDKEAISAAKKLAW